MKSYLIVGMYLIDNEHDRFADRIIADSPEQAEQFAATEWPGVTIAAVIEGDCKVVA